VLLLVEVALLNVCVGFPLLVLELELDTPAQSADHWEDVMPAWFRVHVRQAEERVLAAEQMQSVSDWAQFAMAWRRVWSLADEHWLSHTTAALELLAEALEVVELGMLVVAVAPGTLALLTPAQSAAHSAGVSPDCVRTQSMQPGESELTAEQTQLVSFWLQLSTAWVPA